MIKLGNNFYFFEEVGNFLLDFLVSCSAEFFNCYVLAKVFSFVDISESALANFLLDVDIFEMDVELF